MERRTRRWQAAGGLAGILLLGCGLLPAAAAEPMLPRVYSEQVDVSGWLMSEKLDGVRGYWDGRRLWSKTGQPFHPPREFVAGLPEFPLEGELWGGRGGFSRTVSAVRRGSGNGGWQQLQFGIFDAPQVPGTFTVRIQAARDWFAAHPTPYAFVIPQVPVRDAAHLMAELRRVEELGGEGLVVRSPDALYAPGRSSEILKVKSYRDAEATVLAHLPGRGRNRGRLGALLVALGDGSRFRIGTGFSDAERENPPPVGATITFKYFGLYPSGIPKFPSFLRIRADRGL